VGSGRDSESGLLGNLIGDIHDQGVTRIHVKGRILGPVVCGEAKQLIAVLVHRGLIRKADVQNAAAAEPVFGSGYGASGLESRARLVGLRDRQEREAKQKQEMKSPWLRCVQEIPLVESFESRRNRHVHYPNTII